MRVMEQIGFCTGLGVVIVFLAALALGRLWRGHNPLMQPVVPKRREDRAGHGPDTVGIGIGQWCQHDGRAEPVREHVSRGCKPDDADQADPCLTRPGRGGGAEGAGCG